MVAISPTSVGPICIRGRELTIGAVARSRETSFELLAAFVFAGEGNLPPNGVFKETEVLEGQFSKE